MNVTDSIHEAVVAHLEEKNPTLALAYLAGREAERLQVRVDYLELERNEQDAVNELVHDELKARITELERTAESAKAVLQAKYGFASPVHLAPGPMEPGDFSTANPADVPAADTASEEQIEHWKKTLGDNTAMGTIVDGPHPDDVIPFTSEEARRDDSAEVATKLTLEESASPKRGRPKAEKPASELTDEEIGKRPDQWGISIDNTIEIIKLAGDGLNPQSIAEEAMLPLQEVQRVYGREGRRIEQYQGFHDPNSAQGWLNGIRTTMIKAVRSYLKSA